MRRAFLCLLLALGFLLLTQAAAGAREAVPSPRATEIAAEGWENQGCGPFSFTQSYGSWGPAEHYDRTVTVVYDATRCSKVQEDTVVLSIEGTAAVYAGRAAKGKPIDQRRFYVSGRWSPASNREGWPPDWWACEVETAQYSWRISGVYSFAVEAREGTWSLDVGVDGSTLHWSYDGCA